MNEDIIEINTKIYPMDVIYSAAYVFLDRAYLFLEGDPEKQITIKIRPKEEESIEKLKGDFNNELINYANHKNLAKESKNIREMIVERALATNDPSVIEDAEFDKIMEDINEEFDDPDDVAVPWEDDYK